MVLDLQPFKVFESSHIIFFVLFDFEIVVLSSKRNTRIIFRATVLIHVLYLLLASAYRQKYYSTTCSTTCSTKPITSTPQNGGWRTQRVGLKLLMAAAKAKKMMMKRQPLVRSSCAHASEIIIYKDEVSELIAIGKLSIESTSIEPLRTELALLRPRHVPLPVESIEASYCRLGVWICGARRSWRNSRYRLHCLCKTSAQSFPESIHHH